MVFRFPCYFLFQLSFCFRHPFFHTFSTFFSFVQFFMFPNISLLSHFLFSTFSFVFRTLWWSLPCGLQPFEKTSTKKTIFWPFVRRFWSPVSPSFPFLISFSFLPFPFLHIFLFICIFSFSVSQCCTKFMLKMEKLWWCLRHYMVVNFGQGDSGRWIQAIHACIYINILSYFPISFHTFFQFVPTHFFPLTWCLLVFGPLSEYRHHNIRKQGIAPRLTDVLDA